MPRHNGCPNPALGVDTTGWGGGSTPTRTAVTGFARPWAARYSPPGSFQETPKSAVTAGQTYTLSLDARVTTAFATSHINTYIGWYTFGGGAITFDTLALPDLAAGVVTHLERTGTAPATAAFVDLIFDGVGGDFIDYTDFLVEEGGSSQPYADGDTPGWVWDGAAGLSPSSESPAVTITPDAIDPGAAVNPVAVITAIRPDGIDGAATVGTLTLTPTAATVEPDSVASTTAIGSPSVLPTSTTVALGTIPAGSTVGSPTVAGGTQTVAPDTVPAGSTVGEPHVFVGVLPAGIPSTATVGGPTLTGRPSTIHLDAILSAARVGGPAINPALQRRESLDLVFGQPRTGWVFGILEVA